MACLLQGRNAGFHCLETLRPQLGLIARLSGQMREVACSTVLFGDAVSYLYEGGKQQSGLRAQGDL